jgi:uncharacterized protein YeaO (DUF488 family)
LTRGDTPREPADRKSGAAARGERLLAGVVERLAREGAYEAIVDGRVTTLASGGRPVCRLVVLGADVEAGVDPRAGAGSPAAMRRLGTPHPDRARSAEGWRRFVVRTNADAARLVHALRTPREKSTGEPRAARAPAFVVGRVSVRRLVDPRREEDGVRVFVDESWPRGVRREDADVDAWMPDVAPSRAIRAAFGPVPAYERGFRRAYLAELKGGAKAESVSRLRHLLKNGALTLLTGVRDVAGSHARVLADAVTHGRTPRA